MNRQNEKEQAKKNLLSLINLCIHQGGIFNNAETVAVYVHSVHILGADETPATGNSAMMAVGTKVDTLGGNQ